MRSLPQPGFAGDDGSVSPEVAAALSDYGADPDARHRATVAVLQDSRVLVPVVAVLGEAEQDTRGLTVEKSSDMAAVLMRGKDGRLALLAFSGEASMERWNPEARPVPVSVPQAAQAAVQDGADALVLDVAGPAMLVVEGDDLRALAEGYRLLRTEAGWAWAKVSSAGDAPDR